MISKPYPFSPKTITIVFAVVFFLSLICGIVTGAVPLSISQVISVLAGSDHHDSAHGLSAEQVDMIVSQLRLPRVLLAAFVGSILAMSGAVMQGLFRNPLADPSLIGVTAGAIAGGSIAMMLAAFFLQGSPAVAVLANGLGALSLVSLGAFLGGVATVWLVYRLATSSMGTSVSTMLLAGIAITALAGSLTSLLEFFADNEMLRRISLWRMGGLDGADYTRSSLALVFAVLLLVLLPRFATPLNLLLLGESEARHLGIDVERLKRNLIVLVALGVGISVALAGSIAFIGLVIPHIVRLLTGPDHRLLIPLSALAGAVLLVLADSVSRSLIAPAELPVGIITAALGAPFFISLLRHRYHYGFE